MLQHIAFVKSLKKTQIHSVLKQALYVFDLSFTIVLKAKNSIWINSILWL